MSDADDLLMLRYLEGAADDAEVARLEAALSAGSGARSALVRLAHLHALLAELAAAPEAVVAIRRRPRGWWIAAASGLAAAVLVIAAWLVRAGEDAPRVLALRGAVVLEHEGRRIAMAPGRALADGDRVVVADGAEVVMRWPIGATVTAAGAAELIIADGRAAAQRVASGSVRAVVTGAHDAEQPFAIVTRDAIATDIGTDFSVACDAVRTLVAVHDGRVRVATGGASVVAEAGESAIAVLGEAPRLVTPTVSAPSATPVPVTDPTTGLPRSTVVGTVVSIDRGGRKLSVRADGASADEEYVLLLAAPDAHDLRSRLELLAPGDRIELDYVVREGRRFVALRPASHRPR